MANKNDFRLSIRLDEETAKRLDELVQKTGLTKTQVVTQCIKEGKSVQVLDGTKIAVSLHELLVLLRKKECDEAHGKCIEELCNQIIDELYEMLSKKGV